MRGAADGQRGAGTEPAAGEPLGEVDVLTRAMLAAGLDRVDVRMLRAAAARASDRDRQPGLNAAVGPRSVKIFGS